MILHIALKKIPSPLADVLHDGALSKRDTAVLALLPSVRPREPLPHYSRAEIVKQFRAKLVAVGGRYVTERR